MSRDVRMYLEDLLAACAKIARYTDGMSQAAFLADDRTYDAVTRNLEIIGEAAKQLPPAVRAAMPEIDWRKVGAFRNVLAHVYFGIDHDVLWDVVTTHVPKLREAVEHCLDSLPPEPL